MLTYTVMAYIVMAYLVMAYIVMAAVERVVDVHTNDAASAEVYGHHRRHTQRTATDVPVLL